MHMLWLMLMLVIYLTLWIVREVTTSFGAPGRLFFQWVMYMNAAFITLLGISFFSTAISEEKEENTLGLMTMAGIGSLGILVGKSTSRLFQVSLLLAIQYPFTLLAVTMGGLLPTQILAAYTSLLAYTILIANVGLLCSVVCQTNRNASGLTTFWLLGYVVVPLFALGGWSYLTMEQGWNHSDSYQSAVLTALDWTHRSLVVIDLTRATETGYEFSWTPQIISNAVGGLICFLLSWMLFGFVAKEPSTDSASRGLVARRTTRMLRFFSASRAWDYPLIWKDFFFVAGGWAGVVIRCLLYAGLYGLCVAANKSWFYDSGYEIRWNDVTTGFQFFAHPLLAVDIALCASRVFHDEIKGQTLSSLLMLPESIASVVYSKLVGCAIATAPGVIALLVSLFLMPGGLDEAPRAMQQPAFWWWIMNLATLIHLTALYSLFLRSGAFVLAIGTMIGTMVLTAVIASIISIGTGAGDEVALFVMASFTLAFICAGCHAAILMRLPVLGQK